jgi:predicted ATP-grasp superfamily ATP-dependent carboligase
MRSLGRLGIAVFGVSNRGADPAFSSRYCRGRYVVPYSEANQEVLKRALLNISATLGRKALLVPTSDETAQFVADNSSDLREHFLFQDNTASLVRQLASKQEMFGLARKHGVPTPETLFPTSTADVETYAETGRFPVMLKAIYGNRQEARGQRKMQVAETPAQLRETVSRSGNFRFMLAARRSANAVGFPKWRPRQQTS